MIKRSVKLIYIIIAIKLLLFSGAFLLLSNSDITLEFEIKLDKNVYSLSDFGEPPQIAVWIKTRGKNDVRTVGVTRRTAKNIWKGKIECPTSLPIWQNRVKKKDEKPDAYTKATPKEEIFRIKTSVKRGVEIECFLEINVSGDFNSNFPYRDGSGMPDPQVNGQPSLLYYGIIKGIPGSQTSLKLTGRSDQLNWTGKVYKDTDSITTARKLIVNNLIRCY